MNYPNTFPPRPCKQVGKPKGLRVLSRCQISACFVASFRSFDIEYRVNELGLNSSTTKLQSLVTVTQSLTKPHYSLSGVFVEYMHLADRVVVLVQVGLIDAHSVHPDASLAIETSEVAQRTMQIPRHQYDCSIDLDGEGVILITQCVGKGLVVWSLCLFHVFVNMICIQQDHQAIGQEG